MPNALGNGRSNQESAPQSQLAAGGSLAELDILLHIYDTKLDDRLVDQGWRRPYDSH